MASDFAARCAELSIGVHQQTLASNLLTRLAAELAALEDDEAQDNGIEHDLKAHDHHQP